MSIIEMAYTRGTRDALTKFAAVPAGAPGSVVAPPPTGVPVSGGAPNMVPAKAAPSAITQVNGMVPTPSAAGAGHTNQQAAIATGAPPAAVASPVATPAPAAGPK